MYKRATNNDPEKEQFVNKLHPVGRIGQADEVAAAVLYLCSELSGFTTGVALPVDGGSTAI
jgi:NAD(P)-dependent dehydrogenase (short-subunit alcohol dehydrogenase family)